MNLIVSWPSQLMVCISLALLTRLSVFLTAIIDALAALIAACLIT